MSVAPLTPDPRVSPSARPQLLFALPRVRTRSARQLLSPLARVRCRSARQLLSHLRQPFRTSSASLFALPRVRYRLIYYPLFRASGIPPIPIRGCALAWRQAPSGPLPRVRCPDPHVSYPRSRDRGPCASASSVSCFPSYVCETLSRSARQLLPPPFPRVTILFPIRASATFPLPSSLASRSARQPHYPRFRASGTPMPLSRASNLFHASQPLCASSAYCSPCRASGSP